MINYILIDVLVFSLDKCILEAFVLYILDFLVRVGFGLPLFGFYGKNYSTQMLTHLRETLYY